MIDTVEYVRVLPNALPPSDSKSRPYRAVVIIEAVVSSEWQALISDWLVKTGCLYMMAWGIKCSSWDDSVDIANLEQFDYSDIPEDKFVMTTWHEDEPLNEVFWFSKNSAFHPTVGLKHTVLLHIGEVDRRAEMVDSYANA
jgi:hypothetical protein